jgi:heme-degrading monooxygenase HmoA
MYCLEVRGQTKPEDYAKVIDIFKNQLLTLEAKQSGFKGVYLFTKAENEFMMLHIWETEQQFTNWQKTPEHGVIATQLKTLIIGRPSHDNYEVAAQILR